MEALLKQPKSLLLSIRRCFWQLKVPLQRPRRIELPLLSIWSVPGYFVMHIHHSYSSGWNKSAVWQVSFHTRFDHYYSICDGRDKTSSTFVSVDLSTLRTSAAIHSHSQPRWARTISIDPVHLVTKLNNEVKFTQVSSTVPSTILKRLGLCRHFLIPAP